VELALRELKWGINIRNTNWNAGNKCAGNRKKRWLTGQNFVETPVEERNDVEERYSKNAMVIWELIQRCFPRHISRINETLSTSPMNEETRGSTGKNLKPVIIWLSMVENNK
jgi:hypothetical protein